MLLVIPPRTMFFSSPPISTGRGEAVTDSSSVADGIDYIVISSNNGYSGSLNFVRVSDQFRQDCLSEVVDEKTGIQYEDADADPVPFLTDSSLISRYLFPSA